VSISAVRLNPLAAGRLAYLMSPGADDESGGCGAGETGTTSNPRPDAQPTASARVRRNAITTAVTAVRVVIRAMTGLTPSTLTACRGALKPKAYCVRGRMEISIWLTKTPRNSGQNRIGPPTTNRYLRIVSFMAAEAMTALGIQRRPRPVGHVRK